jgi:hypothetical protein
MGLRLAAYAEVFSMRLSVLIDAFLDGFGFTGLFGPLRRPGAPEYLFAQEEGSEDESDDALRGGEQPMRPPTA